MNFATMLSGEWRYNIRRARQIKYDTARARAARSRNKDQRLAEIPALLESGADIFQLAERFEKNALTICKDIKELVGDGIIDKKYSNQMLKGKSSRVYAENPTEETLLIRNKLYMILYSNPMTYAQLFEATGIGRTSLIWHMKELINQGQVIKTGKIPVVFFAVKGT